jgi:undecaprenyl-diphosphatase
MFGIDDHIIRWCNALAHKSELVDSTLYFISDTNLLKGGVIVALIMWAWYLGEGDARKRNRILLLTMLVAAFGAMFTARGLVHILPHRLRPVVDFAQGYHFPVPPEMESLTDWSSFPSDHASLFFALSAGLWVVSRRIGIFALLYSTFVICLPRIYLGYHYPSDILAGAAIGIAWVALARVEFFQALVVRPVLSWSERHAPSFALAFFVLLQQIATVFEDVRAIGHSIIETLKHFG